MKVQVMLSIPALIPSSHPSSAGNRESIKIMFNFLHTSNYYLQCISKELSIQLKNGPFYFLFDCILKTLKVLLNVHFEMKFKIFTGKRDSPSYLRHLAEVWHTYNVCINRKLSTTERRSMVLLQNTRSILW